MRKSVNIVAGVPYTGEYKGQDFIGVDRGAQYLIEQKIGMLFAVGDFDSIEKEDYKKLKNNYEVIKLDPIKNETDLQHAIQKAYALEYDDVYVYGALGQRIDHTLININLLKQYPKIKLYDENNCVRILAAGTHTIQKSHDYPYLSMFAIKNNTFMNLDNFKYPLKDYHLKLDDTRCISNEVAKEGIIEINKDIILVKSK